MPADPTASLPPDLQEGARLFNAGEWWEAHEAWETPWHAATGERRALLSALILLAAALHKRWRMGSTTHRNYFKAQKYVTALPDTVEGIPLQALSAEVWAALHEEGRLPQLGG